ncbi:type II toxin-antitoxin system VapB family antitoxin [Oharaeibacter diazotrophicus]|uniref:Arc/MetJ family transcription regulator n=1 Tax=Oharaeibacter diazotrophicus TaxID=1920512 RepID=A0A4R6RD62_9HYPH|nr:type II toxin-antitoxin system VapB family antitoxin [Oharaeibacter diazotrophicus]TDP84181.1 Arc/MetJ family transcription regulator [Oharaeibacter diazotrophicus]BBE73219.1 antitoxin VapB11 [Pleomorphomonas sp. SM30]
MRTNIDIDDDLIAEAMRLTGLPTKKATVEEALRRIVRAEHLRTVLRDSAGIGWEGGLEEMRLGRDRLPPP